jgi:glucose/mannose-6-phosphate isomerase
VVARRWKTQINELAKAWACFETLPEANHNALAGLEFPEQLFEHTSVLFLRSKIDHPRNALRLTATQQAYLAAGAGVDAIWGQGESRLAQLWSLVQFGDLSLLLGLLSRGSDAGRASRPEQSLAEHNAKVRGGLSKKSLARLRDPEAG